MQAIPAMKGVGIAQQIGTASVLTYYCSLIALTMFYMFKSFSAELPWSKCLPKWSDVLCIDAVSTEKNRTGGISSSELYFT
jgi:solute carrier family 6 (neurotransmitter transporter, glycine) member 5/9